MTCLDLPTSCGSLAIHRDFINTKTVFAVFLMVHYRSYGVPQSAVFWGFGVSRAFSDFSSRGWAGDDSADSVATLLCRATPHDNEECHDYGRGEVPAETDDDDEVHVGDHLDADDDDAALDDSTAQRRSNSISGVRSGTVVL